MKTFPKLYEQSSTGKVKHWQIFVSNEATIKVEFGTDNSKVRISEKKLTIGKNIGRSNQTTPYEQALLEAESTWKHKLDEGYVEDLKNIKDEVLLPMLAHRFQKRKHDIVYPAYVQPKLDGVRCLAKKIDAKTVKYYSRMGKEFTTLEHLTPVLLKIMEVGQVLDGEIYSHDITFQEIIKLVKKLRAESSTLEYHVFDMIDTKKTNKERALKLVELMFGLEDDSPIKYLLTEEINNETEVLEKHKKYLSQGYEGIIVRNMTGMYKLKGRSKDLQKYKEFYDAEYVIIGGQEGTGTEAGCVVFTCKNIDGQEFAVRPRGSFELRKQWMLEIDSLIGKKLTVRYQEKTDDGIPRFPVGISIRNYE